MTRSIYIREIIPFSNLSSLLHVGHRRGSFKIVIISRM